MDTLDKVLTKYNWPTRTVSDNKDYSDIEREIGFELPEDYKEFLSRYVGHETFIGKLFFRLWDKNDILSLNQQYEILENLPRTIAIGDNGAGEFIGLEKKETTGLRIVLTPFIDLDRQNHIEIGKSFTDFFVRLDKREEWSKDIEKDS